MSTPPPAPQDEPPTPDPGATAVADPVTDLVAQARGVGVATPQCPRCGYDQTGQIDAWTTLDHSPISGRCTECGLDFRWGEVFRRASGGRGTFETAEVLGPRVWLRTARWTFRPGRLWANLTMSDPVRWKRLAMWVLATIVVYQVLLAVPAAIAWAVGADSPFGFRYTRQNTVVRSSSGAAIVQVRHVPADQRFDWAIAAVYPYDVVKSGMFNHFSSGTAHELSPARGLLSVLGPGLLTPVTFVLLPMTLRRCRVRPAHLLRAGVYSLGPMLALMCVISGVTIGLFVVLDLAARQSTYFAQTHPIAWPVRALFPDFPGLIGAPILMWWYWRLALRDYLKLPRPGAIALAMVTIATLGTVVMFLTVYGEWFLAQF
jgi:hypothetical protein